jgi:hypothetical protein
MCISATRPARLSSFASPSAILRSWFKVIGEAFHFLFFSSCPDAFSSATTAFLCGYGGVSIT